MVMPGVYDGFTAKLVEHFGGKAMLLGGYHAGAVLGTAEPLLSASELVSLCRTIRRASSLPLRVDVGAGFGEPMHVVQLVRDLKAADIDAMMMEDQIYPKRAHYHRDYREHVIPLEDMLEKLHWAKHTGGDDFYLVGRTDSFRTDGLEEAIRRCNAFLDGGADAVQVFPNTLEQATELPRRVKGPVWYSNTRGNRVGRPTLTPKQARDLGYVGLADGHALFFASFGAMAATARAYTPEGGFPAYGDEVTIRNEIETVMQLERLYEIEVQTVEKSI